MKVIPTKQENPITIEFSCEEAEMLKVLIGKLPLPAIFQVFANKLFGILSKYESKKEYVDAVKTHLELKD